MKLSIAAGILIQSLPALSEKAGDAIVNHDLNIGTPKFHASQTVELSNWKQISSSLKEKKRQSLRLDNQLGLFDLVPCDPFSKDADIGILSCGKGSYCKPFKSSAMGGVCVSTQDSQQNKSKRLAGMGGLLKNNYQISKHSEVELVECDPLRGADVGILSCVEGQMCVASVKSTLGGFCTSSSEPRKLQVIIEDASICDPASELYMYYDCDCSGFDITTGNGVVPCTTVENYCLGLMYNGCSGTCITRTMEYSFENFAATSYTVCYQSTQPYTQNVCKTHFLESSTCQVEFDSAACSSCTVDNSGMYASLSFDCTNVGSGMGVDIVDALPVVAACYQPITTPVECELCPGEYAVFDPSLYATEVAITGLGTYSCYSLVDNSYYLGSISEATCPTVAAATTSLCCGSICKVCGPYAYIPAANFGLQVSITIEGFDGTSCGDFASAAYYALTLPSGACSTLTASSVFQETCCSNGQATTTTSPVSAGTPTAPTVAPVSTPAPVATTTTPASTLPPVVPTLAPSVTPPTSSPINASSVPTPANMTLDPTEFPITEMPVPAPTRAPVFSSSGTPTAAPQTSSISITGTLAPFSFNSTNETVSEAPSTVPASSTSGAELEPAGTSGACTRPLAVSELGRWSMIAAAVAAMAFSMS